MVVSRPGPDERAPLITAHQPAAESRAGAGAGARYGATTTPEENVPDAPLPPKEVAESPPWTVLLPILASIWAAVFMGALDGEHIHNSSHHVAFMLTKSRKRWRDSPKTQERSSQHSYRPSPPRSTHPTCLPGSALRTFFPCAVSPRSMAA